MYLLREIKFWKIVFFLYMLILVRLVVLKGPFSVFMDHLWHWSPDIVKQGYDSSNFKPFTTLQYYLTLQEALVNGIENIAGNILLFIPVGLLLPLAFTSVTPARLLFLVFLISLCFEVFQLLVDIGHFDVDDLLLNVTGGIAGYVIYLMIPDRKFSM